MTDTQHWENRHGDHENERKGESVVFLLLYGVISLGSNNATTNQLRE